LLSDEFGVPQAEHSTDNGDPHSLQNFRPGGLLVRHTEHCIATLLGGERAYPDTPPRCPGENPTGARRRDRHIKISRPSRRVASSAVPRRNRRPVDAAPPRPSGLGGERRERWRAEMYTVRSVAGGAAAKAYRCPGCDQLIQPGVGHVVAWPSDDPDAGERRHWHTTCWSMRDSRAPAVLRSRRGPRY
jgi:hypothetical protein